MHGKRLLFVWILLIVLSDFALGCKKDRDTPPPAPSGGNYSGNVSSGAKDGGGASEHDAGAKDDGGGVDFDGGVSTRGASRNECEDVSPAAFLDETSSPDGLLLNGVRSPTDFSVTRVVATWRTSCVEPTILIEMSEGSCRGGEEHRLQIQLDAFALQNGEIGGGLNTLIAEPDDLGARFLYFRPSRLSPAGVWGTCAGSPGTLDLDDEAAVTKGGRLQARFSLTLAACDDSRNDDMVVQGNFSVELARGLEDVCPMMMKK